MHDVDVELLLYVSVSRVRTLKKKISPHLRERDECLQLFLAPAEPLDWSNTEMAVEICI